LLTEPVDAPVSLLQAIGVPGKFVVHDLRGGVLEIDTLRDRVGGHQYGFIRTVEVLKDLAPLALREAPVDRKDIGVGEPIGAPDLLGEVLQGIHVTGEHDHLVLLPKPLRKDDLQELRELVVPRGRHRVGLTDGLFQHLDLLLNRGHVPEHRPLGALGRFLVVEPLPSVFIEDGRLCLVFRYRHVGSQLFLEALPKALLPVAERLA